MAKYINITPHSFRAATGGVFGCRNAPVAR